MCMPKGFFHMFVQIARDDMLNLSHLKAVLDEWPVVQSNPGGWLELMDLKCGKAAKKKHLRSIGLVGRQQQTQTAE